jgi:hypothetical protein
MTVEQIGDEGFSGPDFTDDQSGVIVSRGDTDGSKDGEHRLAFAHERVVDRPRSFGLIRNCGRAFQSPRFDRRSETAGQLGGDYVR